MPPLFQKRILAAVLKDDYGIPERGPSGELMYFVKTMETLCAEVRLFDVGPYLKTPAALREKLLAEAKLFQPDLIFLSIFLEECPPETLDALRAIAPTLNWYPDDQWRFDIYSKFYAPHFTHIATTDVYALEKYKALGCSNVYLTQFAITDPRPDQSETPSYQYDVSFVGVATPFRSWLVGELAKRNIQVACFGTGWPKGRVSFKEMRNTFLTSKINLNISNSKSYDIRYIFSSIQNFQDFRRTKKNREQIKGRHFEIGGAMGFQLSNYVDFLERYFIFGQEIAIYNTIDDLEQKIKYYLSNGSEREAIARAGLERIRRDHTYEQRFKVLLSSIFKTT